MIIEVAIGMFLALLVVAVLDGIEAARSGSFGRVNWQEIRVAALWTFLILLVIIAGILAVTWVIVMVIWDLWKEVLATAEMAIGVVTLVTGEVSWMRQHLT